MLWVTYCKYNESYFAFHVEVDSADKVLDEFHKDHAGFEFLAAEPLDDAIASGTLVRGVHDPGLIMVNVEDARDIAICLSGRVNYLLATQTARSTGSKINFTLAQDFVKQIDQQELADRAWAATKSLSGG